MNDKDFDRGVNDYLNHFVTVADAKAIAILGGDLVLLGKLSDSNRCGSLISILGLLSLLIENMSKH